MRSHKRKTAAASLAWARGRSPIGFVPASWYAPRNPRRGALVGLPMFTGAIGSICRFRAVTSPMWVAT